MAVRWIWQGGFGDPAPSPPAQAVASFPGSEDLLDPAPHPVDRLVPVFEFLERRVFVAAPHAGCDNARDTTLGADGIAEVAAAVGAVGKDFAGIVGQGIGLSTAVGFQASVAE